jgi:hypothetical protein
MEKVIESIKEIGFFDFYLPFILTFAIFYGLLTKSKIFGTDKTAERINIIIAFSAAFYVIAFTPVGITVANFFANFFGGVLIIFLTLLILGGILWISLKVTIGKERLELKETKYLNLAIASVGGILLFLIFSWAGGWKIFGVQPQKLVIDPVTIFVLVIIIITIVGLGWMMKEEKPKEAK